MKVDERPQLELIIYLLDAWLLSHRFNFLSYPGGAFCCCFRDQGGWGCSVAFLLGKSWVFDLICTYVWISGTVALMLIISSAFFLPAAGRIGQGISHGEVVNCIQLDDA